VSPEAERKLAAILSADVVGYSRLMAEDEAGTIRTVTAYREQIATLVREHRGRVVDSPRDNLLAEFPTALDAVQAAVEIQRVIGARNADLPAERRMEFRIGVHLGDVAIEGGRIYGDGVNIAARLEGIAEAGGICTSATVYEQVERKLDLGFEDLGKKEVKNIAKPVRVYRVALQSPAAERETPSRRRPAVAGLVALVLVGLGSFALWRACGEGNLFDGRPMIAVLRFCSLSGEAEQYLADGMAEDLITRLSNWGRYPVIARNSSFTFDGCAADMRHISEELGARYVVEGSLRKAGDQIRVTAQLIDAATGAHVWAETYDREYQDIFAIQDEVTEKIASSIVPGLRQSEIERAAHGGITTSTPRRTTRRQDGSSSRQSRRIHPSLTPSSASRGRTSIASYTGGRTTPSDRSVRGNELLRHALPWTHGIQNAIEFWAGPTATRDAGTRCWLLSSWRSS
jgi:TolB-like protein/class 3 adenylate cyclase